MSPTPEPPPHPTWLALGNRALMDPHVRRDALIGLAMVLLTIVVTAWLLTDTLAWLTLSGLAAGTGARMTTRRRRSKPGTRNESSAPRIT